MRRESVKLARLRRLYTKMRVEFLTEHPRCIRCGGEATEVHHKAGRGANLLNVATWAPACHSCHCWISEHPAEAYERGWSLPRIGLPNEGGAGDGVTEQGDAGRDTAALSPRDGVDSHDVGPVTSEATPAVMRGGAGEPCARPAPSGGAA